MKKPKQEMKSLDQAVAEIADLGAAEIARLMKRRGIHGRPCTVSKCPLANLMHDMYRGHFVVGRKYIVRVSGAKSDRVPTPKGLADFIQAFDLARYPDLIEPPPRAFPRKTRGKPTGRKHVVHNHYREAVGR
jgi:hypothetical protein